MAARLAVFLILIFAVSAPLSAALTPEQQARVDAIQKQLLAPCCWQEPLYGHRSELALQIKDEISQSVAGGQTDREIIDRYIQQYGARVLVEPEGGLRTWLYLIPLIMVALGTLAVFFWIRHYRRVQPAT